MVADDERGAILNWLAKTGYPLELHVAKAFSDRSLLLRQSLPYADPIEVGKLREADVIVDVVDRLPGYGFWNFSLVVECKHAQSGKPWIAFTTGQTMATSIDFLDHLSVRPSTSNDGALKVVQNAWQDSLLFARLPLATGVLTAHMASDGDGKRNNPAGDAVRQALSGRRPFGGVCSAAWPIRAQPGALCARCCHHSATVFVSATRRCRSDRFRRSRACTLPSPARWTSLRPCDDRESS